MGKIPAVPGLVLPRVDDEQLYYYDGTKWRALSTKKEVSLKKQARAAGM